MPEPSTALLFLVAAMILFVVPGPAVLYVVTRSVTQGTVAGMISVGGIHVGSLVHIAAAIVGLSALIAASATAFTTVKWLGAAYLLYLGIEAFRTGDAEFATADAGGTVSRSRIFWQGALVNILNPKTAVFFVAFVPQFIDPGRGSATTQLLVLGTLFVVAGMLSDGVYAVLGGAVGDRMLRRPRWRRVQRYIAGSIYVGLGALAALSATPTRQ